MDAEQDINPAGTEMTSELENKGLVSEHEDDK